MKRWGLIAASLLTACGGDTTWLGEQIADGVLGGGSGAAGGVFSAVGGVSGAIAGASDAVGGASGAAAGGPPDALIPALFFTRYEAEAPSNALTFPVQVVDGNGYATCPADGVKEGANCASGGQVISQIMGRSPCQPPTLRSSYDGCQNIGGGVEFRDVTVPVDGSYDVTWWYHCGADPSRPGRANVYGDTGCGGLDYATGPNTGCRSHMIDVNGAAVSATVAGQTALYFHFPCYGTAWSILHGATTALSLKSGSNVIYIHAPGATTLDAADIDAIDIQAPGHGSAEPPLWPKLVTPVLVGN